MKIASLGEEQWLALLQMLVLWNQSMLLEVLS